MTRKVRLDLIRLQIPYLSHQTKKNQHLPRTHNNNNHTFNVLSLLALTNILASALHANLYTAPTCPLSVATNFPVRPSHTRTAPSHPADAAHRPSGENATWLIWRWCPVRRARGLVLEGGGTAEGEGKGDQRKRVWSSEPEMRSSGVLWRRAVYRAWASCWAGGWCVTVSFVFRDEKIDRVRTFFV